MSAQVMTKASAGRAGFVIIDEEMCKGCGLCVVACARDVLVISGRLNGKGYTPAETKQAERCTGCGLCVLMCPDVAIRAYRKN